MMQKEVRDWIGKQKKHLQFAWLWLAFGVLVCVGGAWLLYEIESSLQKASDPFFCSMVNMSIGWLMVGAVMIGGALGDIRHLAGIKKLDRILGDQERELRVASQVEAKRNPCDEPAGQQKKVDGEK